MFIILGGGEDHSCYMFNVSYNGGASYEYDAVNEQPYYLPYGTRIIIRDLRPVQTQYAFFSISGATAENDYYVHTVTDTGSIDIYTVYNNYYLDLNGWTDGVANGGIGGYGTADVYINGTLVADDCADYFDVWPYGTSYTITDIKASTGRQYNGVHSGSLTGTVGAETTNVYLDFSTIPITNASYTSSLSLLRGQGGQTYVGYSGVAQSVTYSTGNSNIATVNSNGTVYASNWNTGTTNITATITDYAGRATYLTCWVTVNSGVARTNNVDYASMTAAINTITSGTVYLLNDQTEYVHIPEGKTITIDLGGKTLTIGDTANCLWVLGNLTIGNGTVNSGYYQAIWGSQNASITINSGTYIGNADAVGTDGNAKIIINGGSFKGVNHGVYHTSSNTATISGGTFEGQYGGLSAASGSGSVTISNATFKGTVTDGLEYYSSGTLYIKSGRFEGNNSGLYINAGCNVIIDNGTFIGNYYDGIMYISTGTLNIENGTFTGSTAISNHSTGTINITTATATGVNNGIANWGNGTIIINGGTYSGNDGLANSTGNVTIKNGTFNASSSGCAVVNHSSGTITIQGGTIGNGTNQKGVLNVTNGNVTITGGTITGYDDGATCFNSANLTISNATLNGNHSHGVWFDSTGTLTINSGNISGYGRGVCNNTSGTVYLNGGTLSGTIWEGIGVFGGSVYLGGGTSIGPNWSVYAPGGSIYYRGTTLNKTDGSTGTGTMYTPNGWSWY